MLSERFERKDMKRALLYLDFAVVVVFTIALVILVKNAYAAGFFEAVGSAGEQDGRFWAMMRDTAVVTASLAWIMFRFFKDKLADTKNPWA